MAAVSRHSPASTLDAGGVAIATAATPTASGASNCRSFNDPATMLVLPSVLTHQQAETCLHMLRLRLNAIAGPKVVADAAALARFDSSALAVLLECRRDALSLGKSFTVVGLTARLAGLAALYGVHMLLTQTA